MWVDKITRQANDELIVINDSKTPSGRVHVGSLRGVLIHDALYRELLSAGKPVIYTYGIDDFDPMDGLPADAPEETRQYMGQPLCHIPAPEGSSASDMADHYIAEFLTVFRELGVGAKVYRMRDVYRNGVFNDVIDKILSNADIVREVYESISGAKRPDDWYPFQVICEKCGKIGTTQVTGYADKLVSYRCNEHMVSWAEGCGHEGKVSPFNGNGKLPWKLEWAAKWHEFLITVEGAGKDHCTKGGSRDVASLVLRRVFREQPPLNVPYEFFLVGGAKMSSSKGLGASAREMADFLPPEILRYLMIRTDAKRAVNFTTDFHYLVKLFNDFDKILHRVRKGEASKEEQMIFTYSMVDRHEQAYFPVNFQLLTSLLQLPHLDAETEVIRRIKEDGHELADRDKVYLRSRMASARYWLDHLAEEQDKFAIQTEFPAAADSNSAAQNAFLNALADAVEQSAWKEEDLQTAIFEVARNLPIAQGKAFQAIYRVLLGKQQGPKAGALLSFLEKDFVQQRLRKPNYAVTAYIAEVGIALDDYVAGLPDKKQAMQDIVLDLEMYLRPLDKEAESDTGQYETGYGVVAIAYTARGKRHTDRVILMQFARFDAIQAQQKALCDEAEKFAAEHFGATIQQNIRSISPGNIHVGVDG